MRLADHGGGERGSIDLTERSHNGLPDAATHIDGSAWCAPYRRPHRTCPLRTSPISGPGRRLGARDGSNPTKMQDVPHVLIVDAMSEVAIQPGAVVSKVVHRGDGMNVTVFGFDAGEELTEHQAARAAVVQVLSGRLRFTVDREEVELAPSSWLHMTPGTPHSLVATEPTIMLLTLVG